MNQLVWLRAKTDLIEVSCNGEGCCVTGVWRAFREQRTVFIFGPIYDGRLTVIHCDIAPVAYDCEGNILGIVGTPDVPAVEHQTLIWKSR